MTLDKTAGRVLLPSHVVPTRYDLVLEPNLDAFTFTGNVKITFQVDSEKLKQNENSIVLHAKELCFIDAQYYYLDDPATKVAAEEIRLALSATTVTFLFPQAIQPRPIVLEINYTGFLNNQMAGFYRSSYTDIHGHSKIMASTQFESLDARRAFPCVDEPAAKAIFGLTLIVPLHREVLGNMPEACVVTLTNHKKKVTFLDTPRMSTYLLAFCVGELDSVAAVTSHGVLVRVYTPPGRADAGRFALDCAVRALDAYNDFFNLNYPLPKLDMVAIPEFAMGAMENWGLVTYREVDLLIDPVTASNAQKQRVATVVTHELAHQWFGNLVTMTWWDDLWLNEGFASWAENWATDRLYPEYAMWDQFTTGHLSAALRLDALKSSHPIQVPIHHAEEVEQVFDAVSYCKGGSVVRMIRAVLGMEHFQKGLQQYMKKYAYGNTETFDLWNAWEQVSGMPVGEMMASWTEQMGFPLLRVTKEEWHEDKVVLELDQMWFLSDGSDLDEEGKAKLWTIPILTCSEAGMQQDVTLMRERTATVTIPLSRKDDWVKLNAGQEVPMRVLPSAEMLRRLETAVANKSLGTIDRAALINDAYALVKAGRMSPEALIQLLKNYKDEDEYIVWEGISDTLNGLDTIMSDNEVISERLRAFAKSMVIYLMGKIGWDSKSTDGHLTKLLRANMVSLLSTFAFDDPAVVKEAKKRFKAFQEDHTDMESLPSDMRTPVFKIIIKNGGSQEYDDVKSYFFKATDNAERKHVLNSLGHTPDPMLKLATMEWSTSGEIKLQDFFYPIGSVARSSKTGRDIAWQYFQDNLVKIKNMLGKASASLMDACIVMCAGSFCSMAKADELESFFKAHPLPQNTRKISQTIESVHANAKFFELILKSRLSSDDFWAEL